MAHYSMDLTRIITALLASPEGGRLWLPADGCERGYQQRFAST